jgi:hypothetical protein
MAQLKGNSRVGKGRIEGISVMGRNAGRVAVRKSGGETELRSAGSMSTKQVLGAVARQRKNIAGARASIAQAARNRVDREFAAMQRKSRGG